MADVISGRMPGIDLAGLTIARYPRRGALSRTAVDAMPSAPWTSAPLSPAASSRSRSSPAGASRAGAVLAIVESMKMEHEVRAEGDGEVASVRARVGDVVVEGEIAAQPAPGRRQPAAGGRSPAGRVRRRSPPSRRRVRDDLLELRAREALLADAQPPRGGRQAACARPAHRAREHRRPLRRRQLRRVRRARLRGAARRRSLDDLIRNTPADGMVTGIGSVNGAQFGAERSRAVVMAYDATVLAGTQGMRNHQKTDRMLGIAAGAAAAGGAVRRRRRRPAGRRRHADRRRPARRHLRQLRPPERPGAGARHRRRPLLRRQRRPARLLRRHHRHPRQLDRHGRPGDGRRRRPRPLPARGDRPERRAVALRRDRRPGRRRGRGGRRGAALPRRSSRAASSAWQEPDSAALRELLPANRLRVYDSSRDRRRASSTPARRSSCAPASAPASSPRSRASKAARSASSPATRRISAARSTPTPPTRPPASCSCATRTACRSSRSIDTPGFMVGPEIESRGQVRHVSRMFVVAAQLRVPVVAVVLRKAYGLGAMAMAAGGLHAPLATAAWPSGEFGGDGPGGRGRAGLSQGARRRARRAPSARRCASGWSRRSTPRARRSTWRRRSRSTP